MKYIKQLIAALVRLVIAKLHIFCRFPILSAEKMQYDSIPNGDEYRFGCGGGQPMPSTGEYGLNPRNGRMVTRDSALQQVSLATERVKIFQNDKRADSPLQLTDIQLIETVLPLHEINDSAIADRAKKGHPGNMHLWWNRSPIDSSAALLKAVMEDDPIGDDSSKREN